MMAYVRAAMEDADVVLLLVGPDETFDGNPAPELKVHKGTLLVVLNKADLLQPAQIEEK